ncbi:hypothetical protein JL721_5655 [Aureococcus anophagefferens]|nr:hypothetical protein JL721_5655 [Aureococcus anophagefferens]
MCKLLLSRGFSPDARSNSGRDPESYARVHGHTTTADLLAAVRAAGGWLPYVNAPRKELIALRQRLPALRERGRAAPSSSVRAHERLFLDVPDDVLTNGRRSSDSASELDLRRDEGRQGAVVDASERVSSPAAALADATPRTLALAFAEISTKSKMSSP